MNDRLTFWHVSFHTTSSLPFHFFSFRNCAHIEMEGSFIDSFVQYEVNEGDDSPWKTITQNELVNGSPFVKATSATYLITSFISFISCLMVIIIFLRLRPSFSFWYALFFANFPLILQKKKRTFVFWLMCVGMVRSMNNFIQLFLYVFKWDDSNKDALITSKSVQALWYDLLYFFFCLG